MKDLFLITLLTITGALFLQGQNLLPDEKQKKDIYALIDNYSQAREKRDTVLLKSILTADVDQLVSTGEWRNGIGASVKGMLQSSANSPGTRTLTIEKIRLLNPHCQLIIATHSPFIITKGWADAHYIHQIENLFIPVSTNA